MDAIEKARIARLKAVVNSVADLANSVTDLATAQALIAYDLNEPTRHLDFSPLLASHDEDPIGELLVRLDELEERMTTLEKYLSIPPAK